MIKVVSFIAEHAEDLIQQGHRDFGSLADADTTMKPYYNVVAGQPAMAYSMIDDGHLIASSGIYEIWDGVGEAWLLPSTRLLEKPRKAVKAVRSFLHEISERENFRRVQATVHSDFTRGKRFLEWLGFENEGTLRNYGPDGADHIIYARIK